VYKARIVPVLALTAALSLSIAACAQNTNGTQPEDTSTASPGETGAADLKADPAPEVPANVVKAAGDGKGKCAAGTSIAYSGTIAGVAPQLGIAILNGAQVAVNEHNKANPGCQVTLKKFDTGGTPDTAPGPVTQMINDKTILGNVGLAFSGESEAVGKSLSDAGLVSLTASATNPDLTTHGWKHFFRGLGNDAVQGPAVARFIENDLKSTKVYVVQDDSAYGKGLAKTISGALGNKVVATGNVKTAQKEFSAVIGQIINEEPETVFYSGYYPEASPLIQQLKDQGFEGNIVAPDGVRDQDFIKNAGDAAEGVYLSCPCLPSAGFPEFTAEYKEVSGGREPATYSPEAYDAATILLSGIDKGMNTRPKLLDYVKNYQGQGLTKPFKFQPNGEGENTPVWMYKVENGKIVHFKDITE
jgi:branched-chain amino acid transport system substrate-binding protein